MTYYVRVLQSAGHRGYEIWKVIDDEAIRLGSQGGGLWHYRRAPDETIWEAIRRHAAWEQADGSLPIYKLKLAPRRYFPRIARNIIPDIQSSVTGRGWQPSQADNEIAIAGAKVQLSTLVRQLERICETVHPDEANLESYGYDIRNLLILACTEVESHWRAVLKANGLSKLRWTTRDYVGLNDAMKLNKYAISFPDYPWIKPIAPFRSWDQGSPTRTCHGTTLTTPQSTTARANSRPQL